MRLWSLHPKYLDRLGLVALWRKTLLAQTVLAGRTKGYQRHPQLDRFRAQAEPLAALGAYLLAVGREAEARGYTFDQGKIISAGPGAAAIPVTAGQLAHEWRHLMGKLKKRAPRLHACHLAVTAPECHPLFFVVPGQIAPWERPTGGV